MKQMLLFTGAIVLVWPHTAAARPQDAEQDPVARFAIVMGKNEPEDAGRATLRYADDDAFLMHQLLEEAGVRSTLLVTPDPDTRALHRLDETPRPTLKRLRSVFNRVSKAIAAARENGRRTELILFYSGHGDVADGEGFVVLEDGRLTRSVLMDEIIARSPAQTNHVIIDACKSYYMVFDKGPGGARRPFFEAFDVSASRKNLDRTGFVLSASSHHDSHEWERFQAGIFSYEVRSALRGGADANQDGRITYGELGAFVSTANAEIVNPKLRPQFLVRPPGRDSDYAKPLLGWARREGRLEVDAKSSGHYYIETPSGIRIADVHPAGEQALTVYLPESRPLFVRTANETAEGILDNERTIVLSTLAMTPVHITRKGALNLAFESIFSAPFGRAEVRAYQARAESAARAEGAGQLRIHVKREGGADRWRGALLGGTVAAFVAGGTLNLVAFTRLKKAEDASQSKIPSLNRTIHRLNTATLVCYSVAAAAGVAWLTLKLLNIRKKRRRLAVSPAVDPSGRMVGLFYWRTFSM